MRSSKSSRPLECERYFQNNGNVLPRAVTEVACLVALCFHLSLSTTVLSVSLESKLHTPQGLLCCGCYLEGKQDTTYIAGNKSALPHTLFQSSVQSHHTSSAPRLLPITSSFDSFPNFSGLSPLRTIFFLLFEHPQPPDHKDFSLVPYHST